MSCFIRSSIAVLFALAVTAPAQAQFFYSPSPPLMGQPSFHLYSVPGVIDGNGLATFFSCTNTTSASIRVGVETFGSVGGGGTNDPSATSVDILPGGSKRFATGSSTGLSTRGGVGGGGVTV
jgi:hypothetical protein